MTHKELETLYHELFHAYMDFLEQESAPPEAHALLMVFAREQQLCRYQQVLITPVLQKRELKEERFLSEAESWEALNETWAVFVGWAVWTQMELGKKGPKRFSREVSPTTYLRGSNGWNWRSGMRSSGVIMNLRIQMKSSWRESDFWRLSFGYRRLS